METIKLTIILVVIYSFIFFIMSLIETKNLKDAFYEWVQTMIEWKEHAVEGIIFLSILFIVCLAIGH